ncbi:hypothetical protein KC865_02715 [Candidatus Kaiserbacteria bacterium]|nr:hypothetical protein [Candidatus Kaiserbacteria bacterium]USN92460.1 MAG: hypothetical protein H6782_01440 [Candidatus Nomurabacteria bacterium]
MENEQLLQEATDVDTTRESRYAPLFKVTAFSKLLSVILFVTLPFLGFWLGLSYSSKQNVNFIQPVVISKHITNTSPTTTQFVSKEVEEDPSSYEEILLAGYNPWIYVNNEYGFSLSLPDFVQKENIEKLESDYFEVEFDIQIKEKYGPLQVALSIFVESKESFSKTSFLNQIDAKEIMWIGDKEYPSSLKSRAYLGENNKFIFSYGIGQDCAPGYWCTLRGLHEEIAKTFSVPNSSGFVLKGTYLEPSDDIEVLRRYYNNDYLIYYPVEWQVKENGNEVFITGLQPVAVCDWTQGRCGSIYIRTIDEDNDLSLIDWFKRGGYDFLTKDVEEVTVGGNTAIRAQAIEGIGPPVYYWVQYGNRIIEISYDVGQPELDAIISNYFLVQY